MALILEKDANTGIEMEGMYYRIDKIGFNDYDFQVVMTGYASREAYLNGALPTSEPRAYTWGQYGKENIAETFAFAYGLVKTHPDFMNSEDHLGEDSV